MKITDYKIDEVKNEFDDHLLDIIGNEFKFDHEKGISEWIKNSVDAYIRKGAPDNEQYIWLRFTDSKGNEASFDSIDFVGMTSDDIEKALKRWGDPNAAKRGLRYKVFGGHGNGGKFYMRQMFDRSYFLTYKNGLLNIFGFSKNKKYGFADGYKNKSINLLGALKLASIASEDIPKKIFQELKAGNTGFTLVRGIGPRGMKKTVKAEQIVEKLRRHPQAIRILERKNVQVIHNGNRIYDHVAPIELQPLPGFEEARTIELPTDVPFKSQDGEEEIIKLASPKFARGKLILKTSEIALTSSSKFTDLNRIDIIGELGVIATYPLRELGLYFPQTDFLYGECHCPILEDPDDDCVKNDRTRLVDNSKTKVLLEYISEQIKKLCEEIAGNEEKEREESNNKLSSDYNNFLDAWKNQFMSKILSEILVGPGEGPGGGSGTGGSKGKIGNGHGNDKKTGGGEGSSDGGGSTPKKGSRFPKVLLSGRDDDPLSPGKKLFLKSAQGLIYQRPKDVEEGIYWINTSSPLASAIIDEYNADSTRWRDYLFQRYVDIFIKEALMTLEEKEPDRFNAATIDGDILGKLVSRIHEAAAKDLSSFLFDESFKVKPQ